ncbi:hypothetical protein ACN20G_33305 (plasmid) [Streptomyces sp. BI20]|uniref:hypothetical protein n=1 Tax=Streptomyces sp. BI20 TaxID=3403460 RepID=UPI003C7272DC
MINSTAMTGWVDRAACQGQPAYVLSADQVNAGLSTLRRATAPLMRACETCPVLAACYDRVRPNGSAFDGVCAARLWVNGRERGASPNAPALPKALPSRAGVCGETSGVQGHRRAGEPLCGACRALDMRARSRAAGAATIRTRGRRATTSAQASA